MINGVQSYGNLYGSQSAINQQRLGNIFSNRNANNQAISPVPSIPSFGQGSSKLADSLSYLKEYSSSMTDLMSSANSLRNANSGSVVNQLDPSSSDTAILDVSKNSRLSSGESFDVTVNQLAQSQVNTSDAISSNTKASSDLSMQLSSGGKSLDINISNLDSKGNQKTNNQMLSEAAASINKAGAGVKATVVTKDGESSLKLESIKTGSTNSFSVSGNFADKGGMSNTTQVAQNASYSVTTKGKTNTYSSQSNDVNLDFGKINMTLKKEGTASVNVGMDSKKVVSAMEDFVKDYNSTMSLLEKNQNRGSGNARQISSLKNYVLGSKESMEQLGLSFDKEGTLVLDKAKLSESIEKDPALTKDLISGSSGIGQRAFSAAQSGSTTSAGSLVGNDVAQSRYQEEMESFNMMNSFSRSGVYNMMNYSAVGLMFNMMV